MEAVTLFCWLFLHNKLTAVSSYIIISHYAFQRRISMSTIQHRSDSDFKQVTTASLCRGWVPETSCSFHYWQSAPRRRLYQWLATSDDNPTMSLQASEKRGYEKALNAPHTMLLLPATPIHKLYNHMHVESNACASISKPLTTLGPVTPSC